MEEEGRSRINSVKAFIPKTLLSNLFIDYQQNNEFNNEIIMRRNTDRTSIDNRIINNSVFIESWKLNIKNEDDFCEIIEKKLDEIKNESISKLEILMNKYKTCFNEYEKNILNYLKVGEKNLSKVMDLNLEKKTITLSNFTNKNIFNKIDHLASIYDSIINNIENNFELMNKFLGQNELYEQNNTIEYFLNKNSEQILNCSMINKFNLNKIDISKIINNIYYKYYIEFIKEYKTKIMIKTFKIKKGDDKKEKFLQQNFNLLKKLEINEADSKYLNKLLIYIKINQDKNNNNNNLKKLVISNFDNLKYTKNLELKINFNKIEKLKFYSGHSLNNELLEKLFLKQIKNLVSLKLEKVNMTNIGLCKLSNILHNYLNCLEYLSLAHNSISLFKMGNLEKELNKGKLFEKLKYFNLSNNNIYGFDYNLEIFPEIKLLDLSSNSIFDSTLMDNLIKKKGKIVLFNNNIFITNCPDNNIRYIEYLKRELQDLDYGLKALDLRFTFDKENRNELEKLKLSPSIKVSLIKLNLSYCELKTDTVINFLKNNFGLFSMKKLNLKCNNIEIDIFEKINCDEIKLDNLTSIDLSENKIAFLEKDDKEINIFRKYSEHLINFIKKHQKLEKINLFYTSFFEHWDFFISPGDHKKEEQEALKSLYTNLKKYLEESNRKCVLMADEEIYVEKIYEGIFSFNKK